MRRNLGLRLCISVAVGTVVLGLPADAQATTNVVPNPGFEQGGCGDMTPVICGWYGQGGNMYLDTTTPHSGVAAMVLDCGNTGCLGSGFGDSVTGPSAWSVCAAIGPGTHPASFWYWGAGGWDTVELYASFYQTPDCTGTGSPDWFNERGLGGYAWRQVTGELTAPSGTQSAFFGIVVQAPCADYCFPGAIFDDLDVEDAVVADTTPPETTITNHDVGGPSSSTSATFEFAANESATFECSLDTAPFAPCSSPASYTGLADGSHTFRVRAIDAAGNTDPTPAEQSWTVDTTPPETTITSGPSGTTTSASATFEFAANEPVWSFECSLDTAQFAHCSSPTSYTGLSGGSHTFRVYAIDVAFNTDPTLAEQSWTIQANSPPVVTNPGPMTKTVGDSVSYQITANDPEGDAIAGYGASGLPTGLSVNTTTGLISGTTTAAGTFGVTITATDNHGATGSASFTWTVTAASSTLTFAPDADTYVRSDRPDKNSGTRSTMVTDASPTKYVLLKFTVSGTAGKTIQSVKLRLYCVDASPDGGSIYPVSDNGWGERTVTWNNQPAVGSTAVASLGAVAASTWFEVDLSSLVTGDGTYSLRIATTSGNAAAYSTKEGTAGFAPNLVVTVAG
jgi:hypothetical protein